MNTLTSALRRQLEKAVEQARVTAEIGARQSLEALAVHHHEPWGAMDNDQRALRRRLRAHSRQLGDLRNSQSGGQEIERLTEEVAYEFWHRMLFARFLAENDLLMYPDPVDPVAVSLEECEQLAGEEGAANGWELAARFATRMLPQIFRLDSPVFQLVLPPEHQQKLERLVTGLPSEIFSASDSLGWVYQFWQSRKKAEVNAAGGKIGATELPAVTQLFTEPYMVSFLLDNSLGAWWAARALSDDDLRKANTEKELREKAAIPGVPLEYLRFVQQDDGAWTPAAGSFDAWPRQLAELKMLDPCCGSGHFLVAVFLMLVPLRIALEGLSTREAVDAVLRDNLNGLELDQRCVELGAFALALAAWRYPDAGGYRALPELQVACSGLSVSVGKEEWKQLGIGKHNLTIALEWMHDTFRDAPVLGSLINTARTDAVRIVQGEELSEALEQALQQEQGEQQQEAGVVAQGLAKAASLLAGQYHWIVTNVPYLTRGKQDERLRNFCEQHYPAAKNDLATVFLDRCLEYCTEGGVCSVVLPQNWLFLSGYRKFREKLLKRDTLHLIARLGPQAFQTPMWDFNVQLLTISCGNSAQNAGRLFEKGAKPNLISGLDVSEPRTATEKAAQLPISSLNSFDQLKQLENPDNRILLGEGASEDLLQKHSESRYGLRTGDGARLIAKFWEIPWAKDTWVPHQSTVQRTAFYAGRENCIYWEHGNGGLSELAELGIASLQGADAWGNNGIAVSLTGQLRSTIYCGEKYDNNCAAIWPKKAKNLPAIWAYCSSDSYNKAVRELDQSLKVTNATLLKVPFDLDHWTRVAEEKYPKGLPKPHGDDPTQWTFHGHICGSVVWDDDKKLTAYGRLRHDDTSLQVAVARLVGYRWPAELDEGMDLAEKQRDWVHRCEELNPFSDEDGIVCIPPLRGEAAADDRLRDLLKAAYADDWSASTERELLTASASAVKSPASLDQWLRESFFAQHCKVFQARPFILHVWDGRKDGFHVLVNYHKLVGPNGQGRRTLESLTYGYLGEWIIRQRADQQNEIEGADARLAAALKLQAELENILEGEPPYDLFIRWKPLHEQPMGWNPDINDGVRLNIRPFVLAADVGRKGAGILRTRVDNTWTNTKKVGAKDRGKEVESIRPRQNFPWFWGCNPEKFKDHQTDFGASTPNAPPAEKKFDGQRWNNLHYTRAAREAARASKGEKD